METEKRCSFYRNFKSSGASHRRGHCEFDCTHSTCDGEIEHCGKLNVLKRYLMERSWMKATIERKKTGRN
jgi:hypothetical protein